MGSCLRQRHCFSDDLATSAFIQELLPEVVIEKIL